MSDKIDIDNVRYSMETQEFFQRQIEEAVNALLTKIIPKAIKLLTGL